MADLTLDEIQLDLEVGRILADNGEREPQQCDQCGAWTYVERCPVCPGRPALSKLERLMERKQQGEDVSFEDVMRQTLGDGVKQQD